MHHHGGPDHEARMHNVTSRRQRRSASRDGMTLIELMVAIILLGVGMLGLAGLSVGVAKQQRGGSLQETAALIVQSRLDSLASIQCAALAPSGSQSGVATTQKVRESWVITDGNDIKTIFDTVTFSGRTKALVYKSVIPCRD